MLNPRQIAAENYQHCLEDVNDQTHGTILPMIHA